MRNIFVFWGALLLVDGVFGVNETLSVMEGDSVTLKPYTEIPEDESAQWFFDEERIARIYKVAGIFSTFEDVVVRFKDKLNLDNQNGSLTITNITTNHAGLYKLLISGKTHDTFKIFNVIVDGVKSVSVMKGDTVPLFAGITKIEKNDQVRLMFGDPGTVVADLHRPVDSSWISMINETGELKIINAQSKHSGDYEVEINTSSWSLHRKFHINISVPDLHSDKQTPDPGLSSGAVAGIVVGLLLLLVFAAAAGVIYHRHKISKLQRSRDVNETNYPLKVTANSDD